MNWTDRAGVRSDLRYVVQPEIYSLLRQSPRPSANQDVIMRTALLVLLALAACAAPSIRAVRVQTLTNLRR